MEKLLEALPKCYQIGKQLEHLATSSTNTSLGDTMGNYKKKKKYCLFGPRKIPKDICTCNNPIKYGLFYNNDPLSQTGKYFQLLVKAKNEVQGWTIPLKKNKELQTSSEGLEITRPVC